MSATRRTLLVGLALPALASGCPTLLTASPGHHPPHPDATLLAMEPLILAAVAASVPVGKAHTQAEDRDIAEKTPEARRARREAEEAWNAALDRVFAASNALASMRATTLDGLILKARMADAVGCADVMPDSIVADLLAMGGVA